MRMEFALSGTVTDLTEPEAAVLADELADSDELLDIEYDQLLGFDDTPKHNPDFEVLSVAPKRSYLR